MTIARALFAAFALMLALSAPTTIFAKDARPFDIKAFEAAQAANQPILIEVHAPWCTTCKAQAPILQKLTADPKFKDLRVFVVDFDSRKDVLRQLKVQSQSTLIVFKGKSEMGRSTGDTKEASIGALLNKAI